MASSNGQQTALYINPLTPRSDQYIASPYNGITLSSRQVMRIKKIIHSEILFGYTPVHVTPNSQDKPTKKCIVFS